MAQVMRRAILRSSARSLLQPAQRRPPQRLLSTEVGSTGESTSDIASTVRPPIQDDETSNGQIADTEMSRIREDVVGQYKSFRHQQSVTAHLGTTVEAQYEAHELLRNPPSSSDVTLELLLASQAHLGHATALWNPSNSQYIFGIRGGIHIISLDATASHLRRAAKVVEGVSFHGGLILFVGTRKGHEACVTRAAELAGGCHLFDRWTPGSITNAEAILGKCETKVVNELDEAVPGFEESLKSRASLKPDLVICLNPMENYALLHECSLNNIPTIGIIDTNANPTWVTYPIPANDDSIRCAQVIAGVLGRAGEAGTKQRLAAARNGHISFAPAEGLRFTRPPIKSQRAAEKELKPDVEVH